MTDIAPRSSAVAIAASKDDDDFGDLQVTAKDVQDLLQGDLASFPTSLSSSSIMTLKAINELDKLAKTGSPEVQHLATIELTYFRVAANMLKNNRPLRSLIGGQDLNKVELLASIIKKLHKENRVKELLAPALAKVDEQLTSIGGDVGGPSLT